MQATAPAAEPRHDRPEPPAADALGLKATAEQVAEADLVCRELFGEDWSPAVPADGEPLSDYAVSRASMYE